MVRDAQPEPSRRKRHRGRDRAGVDRREEGKAGDDPRGHTDRASALVARTAWLR